MNRIAYWAQVRDYVNRCGLCDAWFPSISEWEQHMKARHPEVQALRDEIQREVGLAAQGGV